MLDLLLGSGMYVDGRTKAGKTPLVVAVESNAMDAATFLLNRGADVHAKVGEKTVLQLANGRKPVR